ncbi:MAG: hypothetical protein WCS37_00230 [Chloroflexota bacterium]|nr:hypothetical protein [Chloroflexota bacterium]
MVQQLNQPKLVLGGTPEEQELARLIWNIMRTQGSSYALIRPISQSLQHLTDYFVGQKYKGLERAEEIASLLDQALSLSPAVFQREEADDGTIFFKTTKQGKAPIAPGPLDQHSFRARLKEDVQTVEALAEAEDAEVSLTLVVVPPTPIAPATITPPTTKPQPTVVPTKPIGIVPEVVHPAVEPKPDKEPIPPSDPVLPEKVVVSYILADGTELDLSRSVDDIIGEHGKALSALLHRSMSEDFRFVNFAHDWYIEEITSRYSKGDFRRIRELMSEEQGPLSDTSILADLYNKRTTDADYDTARFALNFRLHKEKKDFEFVGADDDRIWTAPGLPTIGQTRRKASEIGTDYKFLEDSHLADKNETELVVEKGERRWEHVLTFYEYENGVLPYDFSAKALFPHPLLEEQKALILRFEAPQVYLNYTADLRYPTGARGGWIAGLESFFSDNLVPGAILVIRQSDRTNHFTVEYKQAEEQEARLLFYDDRRQKFVFRPIVFACGISQDHALRAERFGKLEGQRRLEESDRKKTDLIVANAFQLVGEKQGDSYYALLDDLYPLVNIERPFSRSYLRHLLVSGNTQFRPDDSMPDAFYYKPTGRR